MVRLFSLVPAIARRTFIAITIAVLIVTNVLSVTSAAFNEMLYDLWSLMPVEQLLGNSPVAKMRRLQAEKKAVQKRNLALLDKQKTHKLKVLRVREISRKIARRTARNVAKNIASIPTEAIPYLGATVIITVTALDVKDGCDTVHDVNDMMKMLGAEPLDSDEQEICGFNVPNAEEVLFTIKQDIESTVSSAKERVQGSARKFYDDLGGALNDIFNE